MKLKPYIEPEVEEAVIREVTEVLQAGGLVKGSSKLEMDKIREVFNKHGASVEDIAEMTGTVMRSAQKEETKLNAGKLALQVHGIFKEIDEKQLPIININVIGENNNIMVNMLCPNS